MLKYYLIIIKNKKPGLFHSPCDLCFSLFLDALLACYKGMRCVCMGVSLCHYITYIVTFLSDVYIFKYSLPILYVLLTPF